MSGDADYARERVPTDLLGLHRTSWTKDTLLVVLNHYGVSRDKSILKLELMRRLNRLVHDYDLDRFDRLGILSAYARGDALPPRKRKVSTVKSVVSAVKKTFNVRKVPSVQRILDVERVPRVTKVASVKKLASSKKVSNVTKVARVTNPARVTKVSGFDCIVCLEALEITVFPKRKTTAACSHEPDVCLQCLSNSIATQFTDKMWDHIDCPSCGQRLEFIDVKAFANPAVFESYDSRSLEACLAGGQFQHCRLPNCQSGQECFPDDDSYIVCRECQGRTCITCDIVWHPEISCADIATRRAEAKGAEEAAAAQYLTARSKLCPNCQVRGEKVEGCDHMTCPRCRHQYCWICLVNYNEVRRHGNESHRDDCLYHSRNLPSVPDYVIERVAPIITPTITPTITPITPTIMPTITPVIEPVITPTVRSIVRSTVRSTVRPRISDFMMPITPKRRKRARRIEVPVETI